METSYRPPPADGVTLLRITDEAESRPIAGTPWEYAFSVDIGGGADEPNVAKTLHPARVCETVLVLGTYVSYFFVSSTRRF